MSKLYLIQDWGVNIECIEPIKQTDKSYWVEFQLADGCPIEIQQYRKTTNYDQAFDSKEEAKQAIINRCTLSISILERELKLAKINLQLTKDI